MSKEEKETQVVGVGDTTGASFDDSGDPHEEVLTRQGDPKK